ncbi:MAG TPA: hypothetical protein VFF14_02940 [Candidatus Deferrimicrobium sp.]|nr:hypothetical protein [Candidatus Deferrimicrobium sp.]
MYGGIGGLGTGCGGGFAVAGGSWWGIGAVVVGTLILIALLAIFAGTAL